MTEAEALDKEAARVGRRLYELDDDIRDLYFRINHGPDLSDEAERIFHKLGDVVKLIEVAINLFDYPVLDDQCEFLEQ